MLVEVEVYINDGIYLLRVYDPKYSAYGLEILDPYEYRIYFSKSCLPIETWGSFESGELWNLEDWKICLESKGVALIEELCPYCSYCELFQVHESRSCEDCGSHMYPIISNN